LTPSPIGRVLSTLRKHRVQALLMGGQACILYGAAEFSRDVDIAVLASPENLERTPKQVARVERATQKRYQRLKRSGNLLKLTAEQLRKMIE